MEVKTIKIILVFIFFLFANHYNYAQNNNWESIGPDGGIVNTINSAYPGSQDIYAAVYGGYLFKSTNSGKNWELNSSFPGTIYSITFNPSDTNIVYIALHPSGNGAALLKSTNDGNSWNPTGWGIDGIKDLTIDQLNPEIIYVSTWVNYNGIYKSEDGGNKWTFLAYPGNSDGLTSKIKIDAKNDSIIYAISLNSAFKSTNAGNNWESILQINGYLTNLDIDPDNTKIIYIASSEGIYKSMDGGTSFSISNGGDIDPQHPWTDFVLVNPLNPNIIYRSTNLTTFLSNNSGLTWKAINMPATSFTIAHNNILLSGSRDGVYSSTLDCSNVQRSSSDLAGTLIKSIAVNPQNSQKIYALTEDQGLAVSNLFMSSSIPVNWEKTFWGKGTSELIISPFNSNLIIGGFNLFPGINLSTDSGNTWSARGPSDNVLSLAFDQLNQQTIYAGCYGGFYKSENLGETWQLINLPSGYYCVNNISIGMNGQIIYIAVENGVDWSLHNALLKSTDSGQTWKDCNIDAKEIFVFPDNSNIVLCGTGNHLYRSTNGGTNWEMIYLSDSTDLVNDFKLVNNNTLFISTSDGVYYSRDKGKTWFGYYNNSVPQNITCMNISSKPQIRLYIGTYGGGVYHMEIGDSLAGILVSHTADDYALFNNYPNPFNPNTIIEYKVPATSYVTIKIYDILGKEIKELVNGIKLRGTYSADFSADALVSGVYFCNMQAGNFNKTIKLILLK